MAGGKAPPADKGNDVEGQFEDLLSLVMARSRGEVGNDAVEKALSSIVEANVPEAPAKRKSNRKSGGAPATRSGKDGIIPDDGNYDDDSEDDAAISKSKRKPRASKKAAAKKIKATLASKSKHESKEDDKSKMIRMSQRKAAIEDIPLGKMGERMLMTFGDGPFPDLEVISSSLLGTRASLQRVILDARALRRQLKEKWHQARAEVTMHRSNLSNGEIKKKLSKMRSPVNDIELSFKAMDGFSGEVRRNVPCGFDVPQLEMLFPEEMGSYQRWKKMHDSYSDKSEETSVKAKAEEYEENSDEEPEKEETSDIVKEKVSSGRLVERLANFDVRTKGMGDDWYMQFTDVRRGSFLPRRGGGKQTSGTTIWKEKQETKKRGPGRPKNPMARASWQNLHPTSVIFLHWLGFDPRSALSPPNEETTQALGFLAYDFFGKIVEKGVSLKLEKDDNNKKAKPKAPRSESPLLELTGGDQLKKANIDKALADVDIKSLYSSSNIELGEAAKLTQLYFGPGFEDRLELEMDELFGPKDKTLTPEEMHARKEEESLFSELPEVPALLSHVVDVMEDKSDEADDEKESAKKKPKTS